MNGDMTENDTDELVEEFERDEQALYERVLAFNDDQGLAESYTADLALSVALRLRVTAYGLETEKPSVMGLKLDLDRFLRDVQDLVRDAKHDAPDYIASLKEAMAADNETPSS